ncbi:MAG: hypothetical protein EOM14_03370 [Clostridia bacterium]|nr:hypothetical protein [Clostridia bacterium]
MRLRFKKPEKVNTDNTCVIIVLFAGISIGLIVDSVSEVLTIPHEDIVEKPEINLKGSRGYIKNIGKIGDKVALLLDCDMLLNEEKLFAVSSQM